MGMSNYVLDQEDKKFSEWLAKVDAICQDKIRQPATYLDEYSWVEAHANGLTPIQAFNECYEWIYGETWEETNGRNGVGA